MRYRAMAAVALALAAGAALGAEGRATDGAGFIPYWLGLGPVPVSAAEGGGGALDRELFRGEAAARPVAGETVTIAGREFAWKPVTVRPGTPAVDGEQAFGRTDNCVIYLVAYVEMDRADADATLLWGSDDSCAVYANGREVGRYKGGRGCGVDQDSSEKIGLKRGVNAIMLKVVNGIRGYGGCARLVGSDDRVIAGARCLAAPEGKTPPDPAPWPEVKTGQRPVEGLFGVAIAASQIGYSADAEKLAIASSKRERAWKTFTIRDAKTDRVVFRIPADGGAVQPRGRQADVGQDVTRVYFGPFAKPGRYYLKSEDAGVRSLPFNVAEHVFVDAAREITRMFYFQRHGQAFDAKHAGKWAGPAYHDVAPARKANVRKWAGGNWLQVGGAVIDPLDRDVTGSWYDAGDPNKYTKNACMAHNCILLAYDMNRRYAKDGDLNIPESGNGVPDLVDEARYTTDYLLRIRNEEGAAFDRVAHGDPRAGRTDTAEPCSGATLCATGSLAWAAAIWKEGGWDRALVRKYIDAAEESWGYMKEHPPKWPGYKIGSIDWGYGDENVWRVLAAAALFRATGKREYREVVEPYLKGLGGLNWGFHTLQIHACHNYALGPEPDAGILTEFGRKLAGAAASLSGDVAPSAGKHSYGAGNRDGYYWGSNSAVARHAAQMAWWVWRYAPEADRPRYAQACEEYLQYILGRNPMGWCYVTNLGHVGAERSIQVMFHFLCRHGDNWLTPDDGHPGRTGCYPGYLVGGPTGSIMGFGFDPYAVSGDYEHMEPSIIYQCELVVLAQYCAYLAREHRKGVEFQKQAGN